MPDYIVKKGRNLLMGGKTYPSGKIVSLTEEAASRMKHIVEPAPAPEAAPKLDKKSAKKAEK